MKVNRKMQQKIAELVNAEQWEKAANLVVPVLRENIFKISAPKIIKGEHTETFVSTISDMHIGMINKCPLTGEETYNEKIRQQELVYLRDSVYAIKSLLEQTYSLNEIVIPILGDIVTNDRIFEGQKFEISCGVGEQIWIAVRDLTYYLGEMKKRFNKVKVVGLIGNHGRTTPDRQMEPVTNNFEYHLYRILQTIFEKDKQVEIIVPETATHTIEIRGHKYCLSHGDKIRGTSRVGLERAIKDILVALPEGFDVYVLGHLHRCESMDINENSMVLVNGCWIRRDAYGYDMFRQFSKPRQWAFGVSNKRSVTFSYRVDLQQPLK